jgi:hypothetical protein
MMVVWRYPLVDFFKQSGGGMEGVELSPEREADKLLAQIAQADSMIVAAKAGARAEGFVLGLESARAVSEATIDRLYVVYDSATEERLRGLAAT